MTLSAFIQSKLSKFGASVDGNELESLLLLNSIAADEVYTTTNSIKAYKAIHGYIPELLATPDITEGGFSMRLDRTAIMQYYQLLCDQLGLENKLAAKQPKVRDKSNRW